MCHLILRQTLSQRVRDATNEGKTREHRVAFGLQVVFLLWLALRTHTLAHLDARSGA